MKWIKNLLKKEEKEIQEAYIITEHGVVKIFPNPSLHELLRKDYEDSEQDWIYGYNGEGQRLTFNEFLIKKYGTKNKKGTS